jgi:hypothetical protein
VNKGVLEFLPYPFPPKIFSGFWPGASHGEIKAKVLDSLAWRKRVLLIAAAILPARKLAQHEGGSRVPATICAISDAIRWANQIMIEIDKLWPTK